MDSTFDLNEQNPWWNADYSMQEDLHLRQSSGQPHYLQRTEFLNLPLRPGDFHIIRGPRQVGKTTLIKEWISRLIQSKSSLPQNILFLSCEGIRDFTELQKTLTLWLKDKQATPTFIFLDEISFVEKWQQAVLHAFNLGFLENSCLVITGSNARDLKESSERFPGRRGQGKNFSLFPISILEYPRIPGFKGKSPEELLEIYWSVGGFPHAIKDYITYGAVTDSTYETYRNWIIGDAARYALSEEFLKQILYRISETLTSRLTWSSLIETTTIKDHQTALRYVEHLSDAFLCHIHYCFDLDKKAPTFTKARKLYFIDPLLVAIGWAWKPAIPNIYSWFKKQVNDPEFKSLLLENGICGLAHRQGLQAYFWYSSKTQQEVDLIIYQNQKINLYEIKLNPSESKKKRILSFPVQMLGMADFLHANQSVLNKDSIFDEWNNPLDSDYDKL